MTNQQLIIENQQADLGDVRITLEYVTNLFGDPGKINLSRSYTVSLPKTIRNAAILDNPGSPAHGSGMARRFFSARYIRNGIDLLGEARAYLLRTTDDAYEVALIWSTLEGLQELSQSKATLNDLPNLPALRWIGPNGRTPDYTGGYDDSGALHAWYNCGFGLSSGPEGTLDPYEINAATHPAMKVSDLFGRILNNAGIPWALQSEKASAAMASQCVLAAPSAKPSPAMERESGTSYLGPYSRPGNAVLNLADSEYATASSGWDPALGSTYIQFKTDGDRKHRIILNLAPPETHAGIFANISLRVMAYETTVGEAGVEVARAEYNGRAYILDTVLDPAGFRAYDFRFEAPVGTRIPAVTFTAYDPKLPPLVIHRVHEHIIISADNRFPLEGNLPDLEQWEFVRACMAMYGLVPLIRGGQLHFYDYGQILDTADAYDWTAKVAQTRDGMPHELAYSLGDWAQDNEITFAEDKTEPQTTDPTVRITVEDPTIKAAREWAKLPFAASNGSAAIHYRMKDGVPESIDIAPRIFEIGEGQNGGAQLYFTPRMKGEGLKAEHYARVQEVLRRPVHLVANVRLNEIDVATLDLARPVYLSQFGRYYAILKVQTSDTDLCKVELIQLP